MRFVDPIKDTPEGKLLSIVRDIEKQLGIEKNTECMGCKSSEKGVCDECYPKPDENHPGKKELKKYVQEPNVENVKPRYVEISGSTEIPAHGPNYNQVLPYMEDGPKKSIVSEKYKMPAFAKTGYGLDGTGLHLKLNDGGTGGSMYRDKVEEALATIKKEATVGQQGVVSEIAGLIENIYSRL